MRSQPPGPAEQLRNALLDLQQANAQFARAYGTPDAEVAAATADHARHEAARFAALLRAATPPRDTMDIREG